jgi:hypothetical protein
MPGVFDRMGENVALRCDACSEVGWTPLRRVKQLKATQLNINTHNVQQINIYENGRKN